MRVVLGHNGGAAYPGCKSPQLVNRMSHSMQVWLSQRTVDSKPFVQIFSLWQLYSICKVSPEAWSIPSMIAGCKNVPAERRLCKGVEHVLLRALAVRLQWLECLGFTSNIKITFST